MKFDIWVFLEILSRKFQYDYNLDRITVALHEELCVFMTIPRQVLLRMRKVLGKSCIKNQEILCSTKFPKKTYRLRDNVVNVIQPDRPRKTIYYGECDLHAVYLRLQKHTQNILYLLLHQWLIPSDLAKCFIAVLTKTEQLRNDLLKICVAKPFVWRRPWANKYGFVSMQPLHAMCGRVQTSWNISSFRNGVRVTCIVVGDINIP